MYQDAVKRASLALRITASWRPGLYSVNESSAVRCKPNHKP